MCIGFFFGILNCAPNLTCFGPGGTRVMACCLETFITIAVCTVYVGGAIGTQVFYPKIIITMIWVLARKRINSFEC